MRRRDFLTLLGSTAAAWPKAGRAQEPGRMPRLGVLLYSTPQADREIESFRRGLHELGYTEGRNIAIDYRYAEGRPERLPELATELVRLHPDVMLAIGGDVASFAARAAQTIPLVFAVSSDPVQTGLVASIARPGGNATGVTFLMDELAAKRLELLKEAAPRISRLAFLWNPNHVDNELAVAQRTARVLGVQLHLIEVRRATDFDAAFRVVIDAAADALCAVSSRLTTQNAPRVADFAAKCRLPLAGGWGIWAQAGGLLSYGPNRSDLVRRMATYVDKILKGAKPSDLPVERPTRFELVINLKTAKTLGLDIPRPLLLRADEVIE